MTTRQEKMVKELKKVAAEFLTQESNNTSLITITNANISPDLKQATVYVTVLPEDKEEEAISFLNRKQRDLRDFIKKRMKSKFLPFVSFKLDQGEKNRQRIDQLLSKS